MKNFLVYIIMENVKFNIHNFFYILDSFLLNPKKKIKAKE